MVQIFICHKSLDWFDKQTYLNGVEAHLPMIVRSVGAKKVEGKKVCSERVAHKSEDDIWNVCDLSQKQRPSSTRSHFFVFWNNKTIPVLPFFSLWRYYRPKWRISFVIYLFIFISMFDIIAPSQVMKDQLIEINAKNNWNESFRRTSAPVMNTSLSHLSQCFSLEMSAIWKLLHVP